MATSKRSVKGSEVVSEKQRKTPVRSIAASREGITTVGEFTGVMSAMITDLIDGRLAPNVANAVCNAGGKMLKAVELQSKYGTPTTGGARRLFLASRLA
jgi:hypothetical protein